MNSSVKLNSLNAMYHRTIIEFEASVMNNRFGSSSLMVKGDDRAGVTVSTYRSRIFHTLLFESPTNGVGTY